MLKTTLPCDGTARLPFYLACEEWIARNMPCDEYFFAWQVAPTVICGRNQDVTAEVDVDFCRREGIKVYRRKSGGGAVFADRNNIMFSYVAPASAVQTAFANYTGRVVDALRGLGLDAEASGRNDIMIEGRKVAGNAYWRCGDRSIVHGTMLYDTDMRKMSGALTPSKAKLESNKVLSVPSRVTTVRRLLPDLKQDEFMRHMLNCICDGECTLPSSSLENIREIENGYYCEQFLYHGRKQDAETIRNVGSISAETRLSEFGNIESVRLSGDFFSTCDLDNVLYGLKGMAPEATVVCGALGSGCVISGLDNRKLAEIIANAAIKKQHT